MPKGIKGSRSICRVDDCEEWAQARGLCPVHYTRVKRRGTPDLPTVAGTCADCGVVVKRKTPGRLAARCSACAKKRRSAQSVEAARRRPPELRNLWRVAHPGFTVIHCRPCEWCGEPAVSYHRRLRFCGRSCKDKFKNARQRERIAAEKAALCRTCLHCGGGIDVKLRREAVFCSEACNSAAHALVRKMAKRSGGERNRVFRAQIADRCGWSCGICGEPVEPGLTYPNLMAPSIDHIMPLAVGGTNDVSNLQLAHLGCNYQKGARLMHELLVA